MNIVKKNKYLKLDYIQIVPNLCLSSYYLISGTMPNGVLGGCRKNGGGETLAYHDLPDISRFHRSLNGAGSC